MFSGGYLEECGKITLMNKNINPSDYKSPLTESFLQAKKGDLAYYPKENYITLRDVPIQLPLKVGEIIEGLEKMVVFHKDYQSYQLGLKESPHEIRSSRLISLFNALNFKNARLQEFVRIYSTFANEKSYEMGKLLEHFLEIKRHISLIKKYKIKSTSSSKTEKPYVEDDPEEIIDFCLNYLKEHRNHLILRGSSTIKGGIYQRGCFCFRGQVDGHTFGQPIIREALLDYKVEIFKLLKESLKKQGITPVSYFFENLKLKGKFDYHSFKRFWLLEEHHIKHRILKGDQDYNLFQKLGPYTKYLEEPIVGGIHGTLEFVFFIFESFLLKMNPEMDRKEFLDLFCFYASRKIGVKFRLTDKLIRETSLEKGENHYFPEIGLMFVGGTEYKIKNKFQKKAFEIILAEMRKGTKWVPLKSLLSGQLHRIETEIMSKEYLTRETVNGKKQKSKLWELVVEEKKVGRETHVRLVA